ncbi:hypothetical protein [Bacillus sp. CECT 9360]|uniref:hypothetical protein n=1 Tax=Bacillus sp. CECT 9360 TaxID=2845821 RepID=UPI001E612303|nr:hypothetical protein [Bacillus sp. CECT 9360]CAH0347326.1 hypothetical protein BCI9360_03721 [Bacillus sp. CECT 9360]
MNDSGKLLDSYLRIWNNRTVTDSSSAPVDLLYELIKRELLDENSHPRTRKPKFEKFYSSVKRVISSELTEAEKVELLSVYVNIMGEC